MEGRRRRFLLCHSLVQHILHPCKEMADFADESIALLLNMLYNCLNINSNEI